MAITITRTPQPVSLASSPILFEANTTLYGTKNYLKLYLRIERWSGTQWVFVGTKNLSPNAAGKALFDISNYIQGEIGSAFTYPTGANIVVHQTLRAVFRVAVWESYYENGAIVNVAEVYSEQFWAVKGGISLELEAQLNDFGTNFYTEWLQKGKFLTWMPRTQTVSPRQPIKLYYLVLPGIDTVRLMVTAYEKNMDGITTTNKQAIFAPTGSVLELNVGYLELFNTVADYKYEVWLSNGSGEQISEKFTFNIDEQEYIREQFFLFKNSINGYDTLWCRGAQNKQHKTANTTVERSRAFDISGSDPTLVNHRGTRETVYNANTGIIRTAEMFDWMAEFFGSEKIYLLDDTYAYACVIKTEGYSGDSDFREPRAVAFSYTKAFTEQYFGKKITEIAEISGGDFNFDFNDDFNIGTSDSGNTTPPSGQVVATEYRCIVNTNGVNTGEQERRYLLADGTGGTYYGEWVNIGVNLLSCPLPPTSISLELVAETETEVSFRVKVDRGVATADYIAYLNFFTSLPSGYLGLTIDWDGDSIPNQLVISSGNSYSNTVEVPKNKIYIGGYMSINISSITQPWLAISGEPIVINGTKALPPKISLIQNWIDQYIVQVKVLIDVIAPQNIICSVSQNYEESNTTILSGQTSAVVVQLDTSSMVENIDFELTSLPDGYYIDANNYYFTIETWQEQP